MDELQEAFDRGFEAVKTYVDAELGALSAKMAIPPDLAAEVASAVRLLHEEPAIERAAPSASPRVIRIERDDEGNLIPVYGDPP